jgi:hypothetical protein
MLDNQDKNTDAFLLYIVVNKSKKYLLHRQNCEGKTTLHFYGNTENFNTFYIYINKNKKQKIQLRIHGNNGYANVPRCNVVLALFILFIIFPLIQRNFSISQKEVKK